MVIRLKYLLRFKIWQLSFYSRSIASDVKSILKVLFCKWRWLRDIKIEKEDKC